MIMKYGREEAGQSLGLSLRQAAGSAALATVVGVAHATAASVRAARAMRPRPGSLKEGRCSMWECFLRMGAR